MAKANKKAKATTDTETKTKATKKAASTGGEYGVNYIAEQLGLKAFTVRQKLRKAGVEKNGRSYSWATKKEVEEVIKTVKSTKLKNEE